MRKVMAEEIRQESDKWKAYKAKGMPAISDTC